MLSPIELAAQCLRGDPTFKLLPPAEAEEEARFTLRRNGCDDITPEVLAETIALAKEDRPAPKALGIARVVDTGIKRLVVTAPALSGNGGYAGSVGVGGGEGAGEAGSQPVAISGDFSPQPCRRPSACMERIAANGRCMECGAARKPDLVGIAKPLVSQVSEATKASLAKRKRKIEARVDLQIALNTRLFKSRRARFVEGDLLLRVQMLLNLTAKDVAELTQFSVATIMKRRAEGRPIELRDEQLRLLQQMITQHKMMLDEVDGQITEVMRGRGVDFMKER